MSHEEWITLLNKIFEICIIPMLGAITIFIVQWIKSKTQILKEKSNSDTYKKYMDMLSETISKCVLATQQTYVSSLKERNVFTKEAQKEAFDMTYKAILNILNDDAMEYLTSAIGDFEIFLTEQIEAQILLNK